jgi:hypothetical protein
VTRPPVGAVLAVGRSLQLTVEASGSPPLTFAWYKDGTALPAQTNSVLLLENLQAEQSGIYDVDITNPVGQVRSAAATVRVLVPPTIVHAPDSRSVTAGSALHWDATVTGSEPLQFHWSRNSVPLPNAIASILDLAAVQPADAGLYQLTVSNEVGSVESAPAQLAVGVPATIVVRPTDGALLLELPSAPGLAYAIEAADAPDSGLGWTVLVRGVTEGERVAVQLPPADRSARFFRFTVVGAATARSLPSGARP